MNPEISESRIRALVADDDPGVLAVIEAVLVDQGFEVLTATDGEEALEAAATYKPEVVLLDVSMPRLDGIEVCRMLRENPMTGHICVVMLTAQAFPANKLVGLGAGADDYLTKPFDPAELPKRVRAAIRRNNEASALNPVTRLPGPRQFAEMQKRLDEEGSPYAVLQIALDGFGPFTRRYGVLRGDMAIRHLAGCVRRTLERTAGSRGLVGHLADYNLVAIVDAEHAEATAADIVSCWDSERGSVYDSEDAAAGSIEIERDGRIETAPLMTVAVGVAVRGAGADSADAALEAASEMQLVAKSAEGSRYEVRAADEIRSESESEVERAPRRTEEAEQDTPSLLRRARRRNAPTRLWDQLAALADIPREKGRPQVWLRPHPNSVVIVDDEEDVRDVLRLHCEIQGFPVVGEAEDGYDAIRLVAEHHPTFVIMDYRMPNMNGDEAATHMRAVHPDVKIIAFSGYLHERPSWADDFLTKEQIAHITPLLGRFLEIGAAERRKRR